MAVTLENTRLHERIALKIILLTGSNPRMLMLGFQLSTAFLSMWISNTATTAMMVPIAVAVIQELKSTKDDDSAVYSIAKLQLPGEMKEQEKSKRKNSTSSENIEDGSAVLDGVSKQEANVYKAFMLSICYSANIGGTASLIGTGSNIVLSGQLKRIYGEKENSVTFATWLAYGVPPMLVYLLTSWIWLQIMFIGFQFDEKLVSILFGSLVLLWLFRDPKVIPGWGSLFKNGYMSDGASAMFIACLMFILPTENPFSSRESMNYKPMMTWQVIQKKFSWSTVMLLGGGYAMAAGVQSSGLSDLLGHQLAKLSQWPHWVFLLITITLVTFLTEFSSNVATASIFIPVIAGVANQMDINPLYFVLPVTIACSFAFMLPVATPPNSIVFSSGLLHVVDMVKAGFVMNILCVLMTLGFTQTWAWWVFNLGSVPDWAVDARNATLISTISTATFGH